MAQVRHNRMEPIKKPMSLLSYTELHALIEQNVITADPANVNAASIDITLDDTILIEKIPETWAESVIDLAQKQNIGLEPRKIDNKGYTLKPAEFILSSSCEHFNLPDDIVAEFVLKSSQARNGMNHLLAGYCDPGWHNSKLTLELHNCTRSHYLKLTPGMKIGQVKFYRVENVPKHASYAITGQYNGQAQVQQSKGIR